MKKRWLIRGLALLLLTLCVGAWVGSYWRAALAVHLERDTPSVLVVADDGWIYCARKRVGYSGAPRWEMVFFSTQDAAPFGDQGAQTQYRFAGFSINTAAGCWEMIVPFYFPTFLSALLLWFVWRKTRAKAIGRAFPVEVAVATETGEKQA